MKDVKLFLLSLFLIGAMSCQKSSDLPIATFEDLEKGAYARLLNFEGDFDLGNIEDSKVEFSVDFYDENMGQNVDSYSWGVVFKDNTGIGPIEIEIENFSKSSFIQNPDSGLPSLTISWTFKEIMDVLGLDDPSVLEEGNRFEFYATLKMNDGREFNTVNTGDNVESSAPFSGFFYFPIEL